MTAFSFYIFPQGHTVIHIIKRAGRQLSSREGFWELLTHWGLGTQGHVQQKQY